VIAMSLELQISDIKSLLAQNGFVLWQVSEGFDFEAVEAELSEVTLILASEGFLNTNLAIREAAGEKTLIVLSSNLEPDDPLALSLRARFVEYRTTSEAQILKELSWPSSLESWIRGHLALFEDRKLLAKLRKVEAAGLSLQNVSDVVLVRLFGVDERSSVGFSLAIISGNLAEIDETLRAIQGTSLEPLSWAKLSKEVGYNSTQPGLEDFRIWLAQTTLASSFVNLENTRTSSGPVATVEYFLQEFKLRHPAQYVAFCESELTSLLNLGQMQDLDPLMLSRVHHIPQVEQILFNSCLAGLSSKPHSLSSVQLQELLRNREKSAWYEKFHGAFQALFQGVRVLELVNALDLHCASFASGINRYTETWYEVDLAYRKFVYQSKDITDLSAEFRTLVDAVESTYVNAFQNKLGENWQVVLEQTSAWSDLPDVEMARSFYQENIVLPLSSDKNRIAVIISDALRFEVGVEASKVLSELGYEIKTSSMISPLPSYTQLGMAALLPNKTITLQPESKTVLVDDEPSSGIENRKKILGRSGGSAIDFESLVTEGDLKERLKEFRLWYVYHNKIDKVGDNAASEGSVFDAVEGTLEDLKTAVQKLKVAGFNKIFITADHGFLYQDSAIPEHGFLSTVPEGDETEFMNRRFIIGRGLQKSAGLKYFTSAQLGYSCDYEIQIPASTLRLRRKGSGIRFVHGGASLQEIVIPLLELTKSSQKSSAQVDVVLSPGVSKRITTGLVALSFTQKEPTSGNVSSRELRIAMFSGDQRISTSERVIFAHSDPEIRNRVSTLSLSMTNDLSIAGKKSVTLRLESRIGQTERWGQYAEIEFELANLAEKDF
jgi:uncharacterized protein (TIGR02687 family)